VASRYSDGNKRSNRPYKPYYDGRDEIPWKEFNYDDGTARYYGSGRVVFDTSDGTISVRLPLTTRNGRVLWGVPYETRRSAAVALRKIQTDIAATRAAGASVPETADYPQVLEYLTSPTYPDGAKRELSVLIVACDGPAWRVCLTDKDNGRVMWKTGVTLPDAISAIELALLDDDPSHWRKAADGNQKRRK